MKIEHPADTAPLSYGCGLAIGLMLILGLPAEKRAPRVEPKPSAGSKTRSATPPPDGASRSRDQALVRMR